jgi:anti-sigma regulatory factor (Ser/Thr protein kinase)
MQEVDSCLFIKLPARSENLAVVRHAVGNVARQYGMGAEGIADLQIVVTEACSNVVVHAYCDRPLGPLEVEANCEASGFGVAVRDYGRGFRAASRGTEGLRLGLAMISTIAPSFDVAERQEGGIEVNMRLPLPRLSDL